MAALEAEQTGSVHFVLVEPSKVLKFIKNVIDDINIFRNLYGIRFSFKAIIKNIILLKLPEDSEEH